MRMVLLFGAMIALSTPIAQGQDLYQAIDSGLVAQVKSILNDNPELLNARNADKMTPLNWAAYRGQTEIVQELLTMGADPSVGDNENSQPLHNAAVAGHTNVLEILLTSGVDMDTKDNNGMTALHFALSYRHPELAVWLIEQGADPTAANNEQVTPLHFAAMRGFTDLIDRLVERGASINAQTRSGRTPLFYASGNNHLEAALKLLDLGADTELANDYGRTPLLNVARESGNVEMARLLIEHGANINAADGFGSTPINLAAWRGFRAIVGLLLDRKAEVPVTGRLAVHFMTFAAEKGLDRLMEHMVSQGADPLVGGQQGGSLLHAAALGGSARIVEILLDQGLLVDSADVYGWTPLHYAAAKGRHAVVNMLLERGADVNARTVAGNSAFSLAEKHGRTETMDLLRTAGAEQGPQRFPKTSKPYLGMTPPGNWPELFAPDIVSTNWGNHSSVAFSPDGELALWSAYFIPSDSGYGVGGMVFSEIRDGQWTAPQAPSFVRDENSHDDVPFFSEDGKKLYFLSRRSLEPGGRPIKENIWIVDKTADGWGEPYIAPGAVNSIQMHWQFSVANSGTIYFAGEDANSLGRDDIYKSTLVDGVYTTPVNLGAVINTETTETCPYIAPDESYLLFATAGHQSMDGEITLHISWRKVDGGWTEPVSTRIGGLCPMLSPDGKYLFYNGGNGTYEGICWMKADYLQTLRPTDE